MKILVIEDDRPMGLVLQRVLEKLGYGRVTVVASAEEGLVVSGRETFDLFFVDWTLPGLNGIVFIERLRRAKCYANTPVLMVTGRGGIEDVILAQEAGVCAFIRKPIDWRVLKEKVDAALGQIGPAAPSIAGA